ncbi:MAG TPA: putative Ig domain-containing protein [Bryobacteraceae bacterium]|nr:putative Ig domain-containing protein [Bryobacteraceae bacterium]
MTHASLCKKTYKNTLGFPGSITLLLILFLTTGNLLLADPLPKLITITTTSLPAGTVGAPYQNADGSTVQLTAKGGSGTFDWCYTVNGQMNCSGPPTKPLPSVLYQGLSFNTDGSITGTPTTAGTITVYVYAENPMTQKNLSAVSKFTIAITACTSTTIAPTSPLPQGEVGVLYYPVQFTASGCTGPYTFSASAQNPLASGAYPSGLSVNSAGIMSGTPTLAGTFNLVVTATDPFQNQTQAQYAITIVPPPSFSTASPLPNGIVSVAYSQQITAVGGTPPYVFSMNAQPPGIVNIDPNAGVLFGTPSKTGTYSFDIGVTDSVGAQTVTPFQVTFVTVASEIQVMPMSLTFNANLTGNPPPPQAITLVPAVGATPPVTYTIVVDAGQSGTAAPAWIAVTPSTGTTPAGLVVSVDPSTLAVGTYTARIQVLDPIGVPTDVPVTLNVTSATQQLSVAPVMLNFAALSSAPGNLMQNLLVSNTGGGSVPFNTSVVGTSSVIASVTTGSSSSAPNAPVFLQVHVNTSGLQVGAYHNTILVSSASGTTRIPVSLFIASSGPILAVNTTGVLFQAIAGGGSTATRSIEVLNQGDSSSTVNWTASLVSGSNWLSLASSTGTATAAAPGVLTLALAPNATQLAPGPYYAIVKITDSNSLNSPQYVTAVLNLEASAAAPAPDLVPTGLFFSAAVGGDAPASQQVQINSSSASGVNFNAAASTFGTGTWLSVTPTSGTASGQTAGSIAISVDPTGLAAGVYSGDVSVSIGAVLQSVNVTFVVQNAGSSGTTSSARPKAAAGCTPSQLAVTETGIANNFVVPAGWPAPLTVQINDDCGSPVTNGNVIASLSNGDAPLNLVGDSLGNYSAIWQPGAANGNSMVISLNAMAGTLNSSTARLYGSVVPNLTPPPTLAPGGTLNNLNPVVGAPLAPGTIAQVYGSGLAPSAVSTAVLPLPTTFNNTFALVGSLQAPLYSLSSGQIDIQIPSELSAPEQVPVVLSVNNALTLPVMLDLVPAAPGVLSANDGPTPPSVQNGAHLLAQHSADFSLVSSSNPAKPGEYLVMYLVGMGATDPSVASGLQTPSSPLASVTNEPTVTVGSQPATVAFAGLTPGFVGLYQINFQVPASASSGEIEVDVSQNGVSANPTLLPVSN